MKAVSLFIVLYQSMSKKMFGACQSMHPGGVHTVYANETLKKKPTQSRHESVKYQSVTLKTSCENSAH